MPLNVSQILSGRFVCADFPNLKGASGAEPRSEGLSRAVKARSLLLRCRF